ncbi:expressed unknown protein [Seminavis robusta]|uniref:Uncharacterized protein n=1 Tax=Seminavis robusta TaxID=568900 RepID=A0A9N8H410_9STRA|nr:expressed unknown protein [Seminavis robusta]|eukprot:Sro101_g051780.1 n/a (553) ;mRNA; r:98929-100681
MLGTEEGQAVAVDSPMQQPKKSRIQSMAGCALVAFGLATLVTYSQMRSLDQQQQQRRLGESSRRELSLVASVRQVFNVVVGITVDEDPILGFDKEHGVPESSECPGNDPAGFGQYFEIPYIWTANLGGFGIDVSKGGSGLPRTFTVVENHTQLDNGAVMFNVETVPQALPTDLAKPQFSEEALLVALQREAGKFYSGQLNAVSKKKSMRPGSANNSIIEVSSVMPVNTSDGSGTVFAGGQGFLAACMISFAHHLPLALSPDDIWLVIANGFARHVDANAEALRSNFVDHAGQREIRIREDRMVKGDTEAKFWEEWIFPKFSEGIANATNNQDMYETLAVDTFSTTTVASQAASEITLMSTMKNYFRFHMDTMCGIPNIRLDGTRDDWEALRERTKSLSDWMLQNNTHGDLWINDIVVPILDQFVLSFDSEGVDYCFWQNMVKFRTSGDGSGAYDFLSGWLPTLFPYLSGPGDSSYPNPHLRPWLESAAAHHMGPRPNEIPIQMSSVSVIWNYLEVEFPMHFHAGFRGVQQEADGTVKPIIGWYVTEDPPTGE